MKNLTDKIQESITSSHFNRREIDESILDSDAKVTKDTMKQAAREWMRIATQSYQNECKEGEDYIIDDEGHISIFGDCNAITISSRDPRLKKLNPYIKIIYLEPAARVCRCEVRDPDAAAEILPLQMGSYHNNHSFELHYYTDKDLLPKHFPNLVHGSIVIERAKNVNLSIMPNCTGTFIIRENECNSVKYPAGFPISAKEIKIVR